MEKLLTTDSTEFSRFLINSEDPAPSSAGVKQAYHYTKVCSIRSTLRRVLMRN